MAFAATSSTLANKAALSGTTLRRSGPFTAARAAPHNLVVRASQVQPLQPQPVERLTSAGSFALKPGGSFGSVESTRTAKHADLG